MNLQLILKIALSISNGVDKNNKPKDFEYSLSSSNSLKLSSNDQSLLNLLYHFLKHNTA